MIGEMIRVAILGGTLALDRGAGWNFMLSQPIVGACLAGALVNPGPEWELWALRIPIGVGVLLQLLLTDASLPAAQRPHDTATAGVIGSTVALLGMAHLHAVLPTTAGGALWVVVGVVVGLLAAIPGGWVLALHRAGSVRDLARVEAAAAAGNARGFERIYGRGLLRLFVLGAAWTWVGSLLGFFLVLGLLPRLAGLLTGRRVGILLATLVGGALAAGYHAHVRGRRGAIRWVALGGAVALALAIVLRRSGT